MLRRMARASCFLALILASSLVLAQTEFSADIVDSQKTGAIAKIYFAKDKLRIDSPEMEAQGGGAIIMNFAAQTSIVLMAKQHMYMEMPTKSQAQRQGYAAAFFRTGNIEDACGDWQKEIRNKGGSCHKVGAESINGRSTVKYEASDANGEVTHFWLDPKLRFPIKWQGKDSGGELRNIQEGAQPASLFEIPAGYTKMDIGSMMKQRQR